MELWSGALGAWDLATLNSEHWPSSTAQGKRRGGGEAGGVGWSLGHENLESERSTPRTGF